MNPSADRPAATKTALYSAAMIPPPRPTRAKNVPITEAMIAMPPITSGKPTRSAAGNRIAARNMTATAVTA